MVVHVDGPALERAYPRYWGPATETTALTTIDVAWTGPAGLRIPAADPVLEWRQTLSAPLPLGLVNAVDAALPRWTWRPGLLLCIREWMGRRFLGLGDVRLSFQIASGKASG